MTVSAHDLLRRDLAMGGGGEAVSGDVAETAKPFAAATSEERDALDRMISRGKADARKLDGVQEAKLIALACSDPPDGKKRWTLRLLRNGEAVCAWPGKSNRKVRPRWWPWKSCLT